MKIRFSHLIFLCAGLNGLACSGDVRTEVVSVSAHESMCASWLLTPSMCPVITRGSGESSARSVEGFAPEWGHRYVLEVVVEKAPDNLADAPREFLTLKSVLAESAIPPRTRFNLLLFPIAIVDWDSSTGSGTLGSPGKSFRGVDSEVCEALSNALLGDEHIAFEATFQYGDPITSDLVLIEVKPR